MSGSWNPTPRLRGVFGLTWLLLLACVTVSAQDSTHSIGIRFNLSSEARIYTAPLSPDPADRNLSTGFGAFYSVGFEYLLSFTNQTHAQVSLEYLPIHRIDNVRAGIRFVDGFEVLAGELAGVFSLPFGSESFQLYVGGGVGLYLGNRTYSVAGVESRSTHSTPAFGLLTIVGARYALTRHLGIAAELRFRDPQITVENVFDQESVSVNGNDYFLGTKPFTSKINLNGNMYSLGLRYSF